MHAEPQNLKCVPTEFHQECLLYQLLFKKKADGSFQQHACHAILHVEGCLRSLHHSKPICTRLSKQKLAKILGLATSLTTCLVEPCEGAIDM